MYTALSRATHPDTNVLLEKFDAELLDTIAVSDKMKAMLAEFVKLNKKMKKTEQWARPLLARFDTLFDPAVQIFDKSLLMTE